MFQSLSDQLESVFKKLRGKAVLSQDDVDAVMREIRIALLQADVSLSVAKNFIEDVKLEAIGKEVIKNVSPANMVIKIVQDNLIKILGDETAELNFNVTAPAVIMFVGLQGSGKTTSAAKLANFLKRHSKKKILLASLDIYRPAAQKQLEILANKININSLEIIEKEKPLKITERALKQARLESYDLLILDTAGRLHIDDDLMKELQDVKKATNPSEVLLVADSLTGQDAVNIAEQFNQKIGVTGIILTRIDGDARGGAALSMKYKTGCPIKFIGNGEKIEDFEVFRPERIAEKILGMGDIVSLVEKASDIASEEDAINLEKKLKKGNFDFNDLIKQLKMINNLGGAGKIMNMIPGLNKIAAQSSVINEGEKTFKQMEAIINSMTPNERKYPKLLKGSRKRRIASGAGVEIQHVNMLIKKHKQMQTMLKKMKNFDKKSLLKGDFSKLGSKFR